MLVARSVDPVAAAAQRADVCRKALIRLLVVSGWEKKSGRRLRSQQIRRGISAASTREDSTWVVSEPPCVSSPPLVEMSPSPPVNRGPTVRANCRECRSLQIKPDRIKGPAKGIVSLPLRLRFARAPSAPASATPGKSSARSSPKAHNQGRPHRPCCIPSSLP
jgi:hypothetical protein